MTGPRSCKNFQSQIRVSQGEDDDYVIVILHCIHAAEDQVHPRVQTLRGGSGRRAANARGGCEDFFALEV